MKKNFVSLKILAHQMSEADLMLAENKVLQKARMSLETLFCQVRYLSSSAVSALFTQNINARVVIPSLLNVFIWVIKTVDSTIVRVEIIKYWQRLKVYRISLERYLNKKSMELFKHEVVFLTGIFNRNTAKSSF